MTPRADPRASRGKQAEALAAEHLMRHGLAIVARNFRTRFGEIDLIARDGKCLVFVEVRLRSHRDFGGAAGSITPAKQQRLVTAAQGYLAMIGREPPCRFDVVLLDSLDSASIKWERNVIQQ